MLVIVTYDVTDKRTEVFRSLLSKYLAHEQNSVFAGLISKPDLKEMKKALSDASRPGDKFFLVLAVNRNNIDVKRLEKNSGSGAMMQTTPDSIVDKSVVI
jgi:CRISPR-associated protein Cas2